MVFITKKNTELASHAGFCYGVKRAVETTKKLKAQNPNKNIFVLGELIHNSQVICELNDLGIKTVDKLPKDETGICIIRSHGAPYNTIKEIEELGYEIVDLTCPDVKKVQNEAMALAHDGYFLIILGKPEHPEVMAIEANAKMSASNPDDVFVAIDLDSLKQIEEKLKKRKKIGIVVQTTQKQEFLSDVVNYLIPFTKELKVMNTICASTHLRQKEAVDLAQNSDLMIVIGSKKSANTTHLAEILSKITKTIHVEDDKDLKDCKDIIEQSNNIGITAGASTPDYVIEKIVSNLKGE